MSDDTNKPFHPEGDHAPDAPAPKGKPAEKATEDLLSTINRQLPYSDEAERGFLSCLLQEPAERIDEARMALAPEALFQYPARTIYQALLDMNAGGVPIDCVLVSNWLRDRGLLDRVGGASVVSELYTFVPIAAHFAYYTKVVRSKWMLRTLIHKLADGIHGAFEHGKENPDEDATPVISHAEAAVFTVLEISQSGAGGSPVITATEAGGQWVNAFEIICNQKGVIPGIKLGIVDIDRTFHGLAVDADGDLFLCGGFPGMGKTGLGVTFAENICIDALHPTLIFPLEMGHIGWQHRLILGRAGVNIAVSRNGFVEKGAHGPIAHAVSDVQKAPLFWDTSNAIEIDDLCARVTTHVRRHKVKCVIIDHFGQIQPSTPTGQKDERLGQKEILFKLHQLRRRHGILIILFVQLDKAAREKQNQNRPPNNGDIRGASEMVEYPTQIGFIHRPDEVFKWPMLAGGKKSGADEDRETRQDMWERLTSDYRADFPEAWHDGRNLNDGISVTQRDYEEHAKFIITKNRNGATCDDICLRYRKELQRFIGRTMALYSNNKKFRQVKLPGF